MLNFKAIKGASYLYSNIERLEEIGEILISEEGEDLRDLDRRPLNKVASILLRDGYKDTHVQCVNGGDFTIFHAGDSEADWKHTVKNIYLDGDQNLVTVQYLEDLIHFLKMEEKESGFKKIIKEFKEQMTFYRECCIVYGPGLLEPCEQGKVLDKIVSKLPKDGSLEKVICIDNVFCMVSNRYAYECFHRGYNEMHFKTLFLHSAGSGYEKHFDSSWLSELSEEDRKEFLIQFAQVNRIKIIENIDGIPGRTYYKH
jgi:hypothetical protein